MARTPVDMSMVYIVATHMANNIVDYHLAGGLDQSGGPAVLDGSFIDRRWICRPLPYHTTVYICSKCKRVASHRFVDFGIEMRGSVNIKELFSF
jgi:hypothetical protein